MAVPLSTNKPKKPTKQAQGFIVMTITAQDLVRREVSQNVSYLISTIAAGAHQTSGELGSLCEQALELATPVLDYEHAAIDAGWSLVSFDDETVIRKDDMEYSGGQAHDWQSCCEGEGIEPHEREVFEHWIVSRWFAEKLSEQGEKVDMDFEGLCIWARTTTGQAIYADGVIERITDELNKPVIA